LEDASVLATFDSWSSIHSSAYHLLVAQKVEKGNKL